MHFKILKMIATSGFLTALECTKFNFGRGSSWFKGPTSKRKGGKGTGKGKEGRGEEEVGEGQGTEGMEGKGRDARERGGKKSKNTPTSIPAYAAGDWWLQ